MMRERKVCLELSYDQLRLMRAMLRVGKGVFVGEDVSFYMDYVRERREEYNTLIEYFVSMEYESRIPRSL